MMEKSEGAMGHNAGEGNRAVVDHVKKICDMAKMSGQASGMMDGKAMMMDKMKD